MIVLKLRASLIGLLLIAGFTNAESTRETHPKCIAANHVLKECAETLSKRHQMSQSGAGGKMMYEVKGLFLAFTINRHLDKDQAREILMDCVNEMIETANHNPELQQYLVKGGLNEKSVQIQLYIHPDRKKTYYPNLGVCSYNFGKLAYSTHDPDEDYVYKTDDIETYEEALALLKEKQEPLLLQN